MAFLQTQPDASSSNTSRALVPMVQSLNHQFAARGLRIFIVDETHLLAANRNIPVTPDALTNTVYDWSLTVPLMSDSDGATAHKYGVVQLPSLRLVDASATLVQGWDGSRVSPGEVAQAISKALAVAGPT